MKKNKPKFIKESDIKIELTRDFDNRNIFIVTLTHIPTRETATARDKVQLAAYNKALMLLEDIILQKERDRY
ncbi:hypothetical protein [Clostridium cadaveris]|uniref:hypothetical protein n=1 Tax=Clostridium cadaveris TaxID=1529 RepID=UPI00399574F2